GPPPHQPVRKIWVSAVLQGVLPIDFATGHAHPAITTGVLPHNLLLSRDGRTLYVTNVGSQSVGGVDVASEEKVKDILGGEVPDNPYHRTLGMEKVRRANSCAECHQANAVGTLPNALAWDGDGRYLLVNESLKRCVTWLDPVAGKTVRSIPFDQVLPTPST